MTAKCTVDDTDGDLSVSVNVQVTIEDPTEQVDASMTRMYAEMAGLFERRLETFITKNIDYGSSFLTAGEVEQALDSGDGPFDSVTESNLYKLFTRIQDKDQRFYNLAFGGGSDTVGESAAETAGDAMVYWAMIEWLLERDP